MRTGRTNVSHAALMADSAADLNARTSPVAPLGPAVFNYSFAMACSLPPLEASVLKAVDDINAREGRRQLQIGIARSLAQPMLVNSATAPATSWTTLPNGWRIFSVLISSEGALGLRVHLESLHLPQGSKLVIYDPNNPAPDPSAIRPETLMGQQQVWTRTLFSQQAVVEAQVPPASDLKSLSFTVSAVSHLYALPLSLGILKEGTCHNDVTCYPDYAQQASGVARMAYVANGNTYVCSGCLIASSVSGNSGNYFLTANHCVGNQTLASTIELFWFYQTSTCNGTPPALSSVPTTSGGADLLATSGVNDFTLLRLRQVPPAGTFHLSWSTAAPSSSETLACIHHPTGSYKRISFGNLVGSDPDFWGVQWNSGVTEDGSSGSPLLNGSHQIIGQLNGGFMGPGSSCSAPTNADQFGRFDVTLPQVKGWLGTANPSGDFTTVKGTFTGLFSDATNGVDQSSAGSFGLTVNAKGKFTGHLTLGTLHLSFSGAFDAGGSSEVNIRRRGQVAYVLDLLIDPSDSDHITGTLTDGSTFTAQLDGDRQTFDGRHNIPQQIGRYTMLIPGNSGDTNGGAGGDSFASVVVTKAGRVQMSGSLADGTSISQSAPISKNGRWPLYLPLYGGKGLLYSWVLVTPANTDTNSITNSASSDLSGDLTWIKPPLPRAKVYPEGFANQTAVTGSTYTPPPRGGQILSFSGNSSLTLAGGGLDQTITNQFTVGLLDHVVNQSGNPLSLFFTPANGRFNGSVVNPATKKRVVFKGVVLQSQNAASGYFLDGNQSGEAVISP